MTFSTQAIAEFADFMNCMSGDFHYLHLLYRGEDFDAMHRETLQKYYDEAAEDYDGLAEWLVGLGGSLHNPNKSAARIHFPDCENKEYHREEVIEKCEQMLDQIATGFNLLLLSINDKVAAQVGFANYLQTRLEYWAKELVYFNARRKVQ